MHGISEDIVGVVRRTLDGLGFDTRQAPAMPVGSIVAGDAADALIDRAAEHLRDDAIGLTIAARIPIGALGTLDYGLCTSSTLRDALNILTRYFGVVTQRARVELVEDGSTATLRYLRVDGVALSRHWAEFALAIIGTRIRQTLGTEQPAFTRVAFRHAAPAHTDVHDEFFQVRVEFGAPDEGLRFAVAWLDRPLQTASKALAELLERRMRELAPAMAAVDPVLDRVRRTLVTMLEDGVTDVASLAERLGESKRSLQRALTERSTSHTVLLDELRRQRAAELLEQGLRVVDVATRLGFSEPSAFFRAYRRWTGTSPKAARTER